MYVHLWDDYLDRARACARRAALESIVTRKGLASDRDLVARKELWALAYRRTPHGSPVELAAGSGA